MASVDVLLSLATAVSRIAGPLETGLASEDAFSQLLREFGWDVSPASFAIGDVRAAVPVGTALTAANEILAEIQGAQQLPSPTRFLELIGAFKAVVEGLEAVSGSAPPSGIPPEAWTTFTSELFAHLVDGNLRARVPGILGALLFAGIVTEDQFDPAGAPGRLPYVQTAISWDRLGQLFTDPKALVTDVYDWSKPAATLRFDILLARLGRIFPLLGLPAVTAVPTAARLDEYYSASNPVRGDIRELRLTLLQGEDDGGSLNVSLFFLPIPETGDANGPPRGLAVGPSIVVTGQAPATLFWPFDLSLAGVGGRAKYEGARVELVPSGHKVRLPASSDTTVDATARLEAVDKSPTLVLGSFYSHRLQLSGIGLEIDVRGAITDPEVVLGIDVIQAQIVIDLSDGDGFLTNIVGGGTKTIEFDVGLVWSSKTGFHLRGSGAVDVTIPLHLTLLGLTVSALHLRVVLAGSVVSVTVGVAASLEIGPVTGSVDDIGAKVGLVPIAAGQPPGIFGRLDLDFAFKPPAGVGIAVDSGPVSGGGFLFFDEPNGRYGGALELSIYSVAVKAFGLIETKVPGVAFSFVIVISAEFTPIQLGFGFTLLGVGGLVGINRTVSSDALAAAVRNGTLDNVLFPHNLIENAPAIISELASLFPAADKHYVFGPLAKLGWGTPALVTGTLGLILELPGGALTILGTVLAQLPKADAALVVLDMDVDGVLDFPKKHFELNASLGPKSQAGGFKISGDMATRLDWGDRPNFAISLGGFHPQFTPPPGFPPLRRLAIDLGISGNPSVTLQGYMALTSNTAQVGAKLDVYASFGATLTGTIGFDALFVFSPFSFDARLYGGVNVHFVIDFGMTFDGRIKGPAPWFIHGEVCVSYIFDSACVGIDKTLDGGTSQSTLQSQDPWEGSPVGTALADQDVPGLKPAILDARNWAGRLPPGAVIGVTYIERKAAEQTPIDPVGIATFRQKVVPLDYNVTRFAGTTPSRPGKLQITGVTVGGTAATVNPVSDYFAPGQYRQMSNDEALAAKPFEQLQAGVELQSQTMTMGTARARPLTYRTIVLDAQGNEVPGAGQPHLLSARHLDGLWLSTSAARLSARLTGTTRFIDITQPPRITDALETFTLTFKSTLGAVPGVAAGVNRSVVAALLDAQAGTSPFKRQQYQIVGSFLAAA